MSEQIDMSNIVRISWDDGFQDESFWHLSHNRAIVQMVWYSRWATKKSGPIIFFAQILKMALNWGSKNCFALKLKFDR